MAFVMKHVYDGKMTLSNFLLEQILGVLPMISQTVNNLNCRTFLRNKIASVKMLAGLIEIVGPSVNTILPQVR